MSKVLLDHIEGVFLDVSDPPIPNLHALNYLPSGLFSLAATVKIEEGKRVQRDGNAKVMELFDHIPFTIPCTFHCPREPSVLRSIPVVRFPDLLRDGRPAHDHFEKTRCGCSESAIRLQNSHPEWKEGSAFLHKWVYTDHIPYTDRTSSTFVLPSWPV